MTKKLITKALIALTIMVSGSLLLDQASKIHAEKNLKVWSDPGDLKLYRGRRVPLFTIGAEAESRDSGNYVSLNLNYVRNQGAAWGMLSDAKDHIRVPFFFIVTILAIGAIAFYFATTPAHHKLARFSLALILSGAIGNFIDRVRLGYVIDWIDVHWRIVGWQYYFPNFNVADSAITIGVTLLMIDTVLVERQRHKKANA